MTKQILVPPTMMERVEHVPTSAVPFLASVTVDDDGSSVPRPNRITYGAVLIDALASSRIEGIRATVTQAALAYQQPRHPDVTAAGRAVAANMHAILSASDGTATYADHRVAHTRLMRGQGTPGYAGGYRDVNVRVSEHIGPAPRRVPGLMNDLAQFVSTRPRGITAAAVAHAQFETIHPYPDGNGRIGRALLTGHLGAPISLHLARNKHSYFDALRDYRLGDATPIAQLIGDGFRVGSELIEYTAEYDTLDDAGLSPEARAVARRLLQVPVGTIPRMLRSGAASARRGFEELTELGYVAAVSEEGPDTVYAYLPVVREWISLSETNLYATHYEGSWKRELNVRL